MRKYALCLFLTIHTVFSSPLTTCFETFSGINASEFSFKQTGVNLGGHAALNGIEHLIAQSCTDFFGNHKRSAAFAQAGMLSLHHIFAAITTEKPQLSKFLLANPALLTHTLINICATILLDYQAKKITLIFQKTSSKDTKAITHTVLTTGLIALVVTSHIMQWSLLKRAHHVFSKLPRATGIIWSRTTPELLNNEEYILIDSPTNQFFNVAGNTLGDVLRNVRDEYDKYLPESSWKKPLGIALKLSAFPIKKRAYIAKKDLVFLAVPLRQQLINLAHAQQHNRWQAIAECITNHQHISDVANNLHKWYRIKNPRTYTDEEIKKIHEERGKENPDSSRGKPIEKRLNHYVILGVQENANQKEIKKARDKLARKIHTDKSNEDTSKIQQLNESYAILSDPVKRFEFDEDLKAHPELYATK